MEQMRLSFRAWRSRDRDRAYLSSLGSDELDLLANDLGRTAAELRGGTATSRDV